MKKVRLSEEELKAIVETAREVFGKGVKLWLFGSRVNPNAKGGDIDLYAEIEPYEDVLRKKLDFLVKLEEKIGEQRVDLILRPFNDESFISKMAKEEGVRLL